MKAKITKSQYTKRMNALLAKKALAESEVEIMCQLFENHSGDAISLELTDWANGFHDAVWNIDQEIKALDFEWNTRNFTGSDWNSYELVASNID